MPTPTTLILGYGNPLRSDDAIGWLIAEDLLTLQLDASIEIMALHQLTPDLAEPLSRVQRAIFIDARADQAPGVIDVHELEPAQSAPSISSTHHLLPANLLSLARMLYGQAPQAYEVSIGAQEFAHGEHLSPAVEAARAQAQDIILKLCL